MRICIALALLLSIPGTSAAQVPEAAISALVKITGQRDGTKLCGSGFVVGLEAGKATIVTAAHVVEGIQSFEVLFAADPTESRPGDRVLGRASADPNGLAVVQVRGSIPAGVTVLSFEVERKPRDGESLQLLGFPALDEAVRIRQGVLSGRDGNLLLVDQRVAEGFSGGPLLQGGKVVGVIGATEDLRADQTTAAVSALVAREALAGWRIRLGGRTGLSVAPQKTPAPCTPGEELIENGITYVRLCAGTFTMGSAANDSQAEDDEKPSHEVTLSEFWLGRTEITSTQYRRFRANHVGEDSLPVTMVTWDDANAACESFGGRLPTEAEWEYAARAGSTMPWSFGDDEKLLGEYAWHGGNSNEKSHPVGTKRANAWGLVDMHGNVWEWVADWYGTYPSAAQTDPRGPATAPLGAVMRGGAFDAAPRGLRSASRMWDVPTDRTGYIGFRCARDAVLGWGGRLGGTSVPEEVDTVLQGKPVPAAPQAGHCVPGQERRDDGITYVRICAGTFTMGSASDDPQSYPHEKPARQVTVSEFWLGKSEVTNAQFRRFRSEHMGEDLLPVTNVRWDDAKAACEFFGGRLPTEAEWEYGARAGSVTAWSFGDDEGKVGEYAWFAGNWNDKLTRVKAVGKKLANPWGLFDMHGNAWEWVSDWYGSYSASVNGDPRGPANRSARVMRGGGLQSSARGVRSAIRSWMEPSRRDWFLGFRCAREARRQP